ncbi:MAG: hypothetical protein PHP00_06790 [Thiotrichaceae bacterium]|nr:hypothetical protein [Thiotrichaceae bacterium]
MMLNYIHIPSNNAIRNPDQHRGALEEVSHLMERPRFTPAAVERLSILKTELDNYAYWAFPCPDLLTKIYAANPILEHRGIGLDYFLSHHHTLWTTAGIEELAMAGSEAIRDYPQDYLPLLPQQAAILAGFELAEELGEIEFAECNHGSY